MVRRGKQSDHEARLTPTEGEGRKVEWKHSRILAVQRSFGKTAGKDKFRSSVSSSMLDHWLVIPVSSIASHTYHWLSQPRSGGSWLVTSLEVGDLKGTFSWLPFPS